MGGWGSGWHNRTSRLAVEDCVRLSISHVRSAKALPADLGEDPAVSFVIAGETRRAELTHTGQPTGGIRWWFTCPSCGSRRGVLYAAPASSNLACRSCLNLTYRTRRLSTSDRWMLQAQRYFSRAGCSSSDSFYYKPRRMRWSTFNALIDRAEEYEEAAFGAGLARLLARVDPEFRARYDRARGKRKHP